MEVTYELFRPLPMDAGVYMCIAESDVDTVMRNLTVAVRGELGGGGREGERAGRP